MALILMLVLLMILLKHILAANMTNQYSIGKYIFVTNILGIIRYALNYKKY